MGAQDQQRKGYPKSQLKRDWTVYKYCGGIGDAFCAQVQNNTQVRYAIEVNPFLVYNESLLLRNPALAGVALYVDQGPAFICDHSYTLGTEQNWYLAFSADGVLTDAECIAQGLVQSGTPPFDIEVSAKKLPQPTDPSWDDKIYVHICWKDPLWVADQVLVDDVQYLRTVKHNYHVRQ